MLLMAVRVGSGPWGGGLPGECGVRDGKTGARRWTSDLGERRHFHHVEKPEQRLPSVGANAKQERVRPC